MSSKRICRARPSSIVTVRQTPYQAVLSGDKRVVTAGEWQGDCDEPGPSGFSARTLSCRLYGQDLFAETDITRLHFQLSHAKGTIDDLKSQLSVLRDRHKEMTDSATTNMKALATARGLVSELQEENIRLKNQIGTAQHSVSQLDQENSSLKSRVDELSDSVDELIKERFKRKSRD